MTSYPSPQRRKAARALAQAQARRRETAHDRRIRVLQIIAGALLAFVTLGGFALDLWERIQP